ncbi:circularly permuted type 2 ATP-grasp protein [Methylobacterium sp. ID0610]|uniref:circularly permuted type 2 ATP-grasp protein n=1 Tax=Methylobacterium carpenticola TaxID=3344827 RepID=UPI0036CD5078
MSAVPLAASEGVGAARAERRARWSAGYRPLPGVPDELLRADGTTARAWDVFLDRLSGLPEDEIDARLASAERHIHNTGVAYRVYGEAAERDWPLGVLPLIVDGDEWEEISAGIVQRASLLETVLADLYGEGRLVAAGLIPAAAVAGSPEFLRPLHGVRQPGGGRQLHLYAADLSRGPDGRWRVLADRTQAPSGIGYALENRMVLARALPEVHGALDVERLAPFFQEFRDGLAAAAERTEPRIGLLTSGPYGDTYGEQAVLARYLGLALVEGDDLIVQEDRVYVRTVAGLKRADVLWRRVDGDFVDPLALNPDSRLGVPGLVEALKAGACVMGNMPGAGLVEGGWLAAYLPRLAEHLFGRPLRLPGLSTWWCGDAAQRAEVLARADALTLRPAAAPAQGAFTNRTFGGRDCDETARLLAILRDRPGDLVAQEPVQLSTAPVWDGSGLVPRPFVLRVFAAAVPGGWAVMPGGFCRISDHADVQPVAMGAGVRAADVWVLAGRGGDAAQSLPRPDQPSVRRVQGLLPSRAADNLFWLGRYLERAEAMLRLGVCLLSGTGAVSRREEDLGTHARLRGLLHAWGAVPSTFGPPAALAAHALSGREAWGSALAQVSAARRNAASLRERLSFETWRALSALLDVLQRPEAAPASEAAWLDRAERALELTSALAGLAQENMNRAGGWPFVDMGRRIERAINTCRLAAVFAADGASGDDLAMLLQLVDSRISYGSRYLLGVALAPVRDMVMLDPFNPRSVAFQVERLGEHLAGLPALRQDGLPEPQTRLVRRLAGEIASAEAAILSAADLQSWETRLWAIAEAVGARYFPGGSDAARPERLVALA